MLLCFNPSVMLRPDQFLMRADRVNLLQLGYFIALILLFLCSFYHIISYRMSLPPSIVPQAAFP